MYVGYSCCNVLPFDVDVPNPQEKCGVPLRSCLSITKEILFSTDRTNTAGGYDVEARENGPKRGSDKTIS